MTQSISQNGESHPLHASNENVVNENVTSNQFTTTVPKTDSGCNNQLQDSQESSEKYERTAGCWSGYEYPDGTYSIGRVTERKRKADKEYDQDLRDSYHVVEWDEFDPSVEGNWNHEKKLILDEEKAAGKLPAFKLDPPHELSQDKKRYGQKGITRNGKRKVKAGCTLLEREYGKKRLCLATITLPSEDGGLDSAALYYFCKNWNIFQKRFLQEIKRELKRQGAPTEFIAVTEFQEKRYERLGEPAPHIHFCYCGRAKNGRYYLHPDRVRQILKNVLENMGAENVDTSAAVNLQRIKKSAANYLSKYMSKGGEILEKLKEHGLENCIPNQWWSPVGGMRKWLKKNIRKISANLAEFLVTANEEDEGIIATHQISIQLEGKITLSKSKDGKMQIKEDDDSELVVGVWVKVERKMFELLSGIKWNSPLSYL